MMASLTSFLIWLPQGFRVWRYRHAPARLQSIVLSTQGISLAGSVLWGAYALLIDSFWLGAPSLVNGPIAIATLVVCARARRSIAATGVPAASAVLTAPTASAVPVSALRTATGSFRVVDARGLVAA